MHTILKVVVRQEAGQKRIYPDDETSKLLLSLIPKRKSFTQNDIDTLKKLGYTFEIVHVKEVL